MGLSELTASVVSGIAAVALLAAKEAVAALTSVAGACGEAAFAACCMTASESTITETTGKNKIIHRIFMEKPLFLLWDGIIPQAVERRHPTRVRRGAIRRWPVGSSAGHLPGSG